MVSFLDTSARRFGRAGIIAGVVALAGCDFSVTNPGPVNDVFLNDEAAFGAVVNGIPRSLSGGLNELAVDVAIRTRELHAAQANEYVNVYYESHIGTVNPNFDAGYSQISNARWAGEDAIRRMTDVLGAEAAQNAHVARAHLWTGYAYRFMGEFFCEVTMDGSAPMPSDEFLKLAEEHFTKAIQIGAAAGQRDVELAGYAGRASVRVALEKWAEAVSDAAHVPSDFEWSLPFYRQGDWRLYNGIHWYSANQPYRTLTVWNTPYEEYYTETQDPRTPWQAHEDIPFGGGSLAPWGPVPWYTQEKHSSPESPMRMSSGREMRLVEAEAALMEGRMADAMAIINNLRTSVGVDPWPAPASMNEAWSLLKRERGIELWLEGRRLGDFRRWADNNIPGALTPEEMGLTEGGPDLSNRALCVGIPNSERNTNPHLEPL